MAKLEKKFNEERVPPELAGQREGKKRASQERASGRFSGHGSKKKV